MRALQDFLSDYLNCYQDQLFQFEKYLMREQGASGLHYALFFHISNLIYSSAKSKDQIKKLVL